MILTSGRGGANPARTVRSLTDRTSVTGNRGPHNVRNVVPIEGYGQHYSAFDDDRRPALVLANLPFAAVGGVFALWLRGFHLGVSAAIGFIALFGVAVLNGLVLLTTVERRRASGASPVSAAIDGARERLRPVLMTAFVASVGFLPVATSHGVGAEVQRPLATVVIGGLATSTLLTLFVLPSLYAFFAKRRDRKRSSGLLGAP